MLHLPEFRSGLKTPRPLKAPHLVRYSKVVLALSLLTTGAIMGMRTLGWLQLFELNAYDQILRQQPRMDPDSRLLIVGITETDIQTYGWPIPDYVMAEALKTLQSYQPTVIGFDLYRDIFHPPGTEQLRSQFAAPNVIVIEELGGNSAVASPPGIPPERVGFNNLLLDSDKVVRRNLMVVLLGEEEKQSFALRVSQAYLSKHGTDLTRLPDRIQLGDTTFQDLKTHSGGYHLSSSGYQILTRYHSEMAPSEQVSLEQVLSGDINPELIQDRVVLIGTVAPSLKDLFYTPNMNRSEASRTPGVVIHAHFISQILRAVLDQERLMWFMPNWAEALWILGWAILGGTVAWSIRHPVIITVTIVAAGGLLIGSCYVLFLQSGWLPLWPALLGLFATSGAVFTYGTLYRLFYDTLTGLPQKTLFLRSVKQAITPSRLFWADSVRPEVKGGTMLCLDLNGFKRINESLGHKQGDRILLVMTQRLRQTLPQNSRLSRLVSDKFVVWVNALEQGEAAIALARSIQDCVKQPINLNGQEVVMSASIGIALHGTNTVRDVEELFRDAQTAM
ncbi:MAG: CHASE2 domain-containing protein, partial [Leptolyngbyaceae bacterium]|nr:CHASE2 domain-containing protein [Leptolyngbyaceae bacterium]